MVISLYHVFSPFFAICILANSDGIIIFGGPEILQGVMRLHVRYVFNLFHYITMANKIPPLYKIDSFYSSKAWPLRALPCVEGTVSGSG